MRTHRRTILPFVLSLLVQGCAAFEASSASRPVSAAHVPDATPVWEQAPSPPMPSPADIEHARRLGDAELFDRPAPSDRDKVIQNLTALPLLPELLQTPRWHGTMHSSPLPNDRMAATLAVAEHPRILVELAYDPSSPVRGHAAALAAYLRIEAVVPALLSVLDTPLPPGPWHGPGGPSETSFAAKARANRYAEAVAAWRVAVVGLASFDRRELFPRLTAILFDPPSWFTPPAQLDLERDRPEIDHARAAVYRMLVRGGGPAEWEGLVVFEAQSLPEAAGLPSGTNRDEAAVVAAVVRYFAGIEHRRRPSVARTRIDQVAIRGDRARARLDAGSRSSRDGLRVSLRRQDGIWRVDDYWPCQVH